MFYSRGYGITTIMPKSKVKRVLESTDSPQAALLAAKKLVTARGFDGAATVIKKLANSPKSQGDAITAALENPEPPIMMTAEEAWSHMVLTDKTKEQYKMDRKMQKKRRAVHYPDYNLARITTLSGYRISYLTSF